VWRSGTLDDPGLQRDGGASISRSLVRRGSPWAIVAIEPVQVVDPESLERPDQEPEQGEAKGSATR
jgi:hypothetical protein